MAEELYRIECDPDCGFLIQSHDQSEALDIAQRHVQDIHKKDLSLEELRSSMKVVAKT